MAAGMTFFQALYMPNMDRKMLKRMTLKSQIPVKEPDPVSCIWFWLLSQLVLTFKLIILVRGLLRLLGGPVDWERSSLSLFGVLPGFWDTVWK